MTRSRRQSNASAINKAATIRQVAEQAGVSTATVSRVLSGASRVSDELIKRVTTAAEKLNYHPNRTARGLRTQRSYTAALIIPDIENPFFTSIARGVEQILRAEGYSLILTNSDEDHRIEMQHLMQLHADGIAGVILAPTSQDARKYEQLVEAGMNLVAIDRIPRKLRADSVSVNNQDAIYQATQHLYEMGHRHIGFISGLPNVSTARERRQGFDQAIKDLGITTLPEWIQQGNFRQEDGFAAMNRILQLENRPTAVITANNMMTLGALKAIYQNKLVIPDDIAIVGFDDVEWAGSLNPPLTVIAQPTRELGQAAARLLLGRIKRRDMPYHYVVLNTQLIVRDSSGPHKSHSEAGAAQAIFD
ncbi:MAG: LacI family transcriptional regulator [Chloroflexi bacterium]|nr:LacI family transcriptional regulator [Chloroflexota bacterium]